MKQLIFLLLSLAIMPLNCTDRETELVQQIAKKTHELQKSKKQRNHKHGKQRNKLNKNIKKWGDSLKADEKKLKKLLGYENQESCESAHTKQNNTCTKRLSASCKKYYPDLVMGTLCAMTLCAVFVDLAKDY